MRLLPCYSWQPFEREGGPNAGGAVHTGRSVCLSNLIEATALIKAATMSHTCATKESMVPFPDSLEREEGYERADRIASILPRKLGDGKKAGG
jgi:hypothetical protein